MDLLLADYKYNSSLKYKFSETSKKERQSTVFDRIDNLSLRKIKNETRRWIMIYFYKTHEKYELKLAGYR